MPGNPPTRNPLVVQVLLYQTLRVLRSGTELYHHTLQFLLVSSRPSLTLLLSPLPLPNSSNVAHFSTVALATVYISASFSGKCLEG